MSAKFFHHPIHGAVLSDNSETEMMLADGYYETPEHFPEEKGRVRRAMLKEMRFKTAKEITDAMEEVMSEMTVDDCLYMLDLENGSHQPRRGLITSIKRNISKLEGKSEDIIEGEEDE